MRFRFEIILSLFIFMLTANASDNLLLLSRNNAEEIRRRIKAGNPEFIELKNRLINLADESVEQGPWSVTFTPAKAISGNPHDYFSEGPYWWPDPKNPDGPYIRRDGEVYPNRFDAHRRALAQMGDAILTLGMAAYFSGDKKYADRAALVADTWFANEKTKMNPHLEYGQAIVGRTNGRGIGLIETRSLMPAVIGFYFLKESGFWPVDNENAVKEWFKSFLTWMTTSEKGLDEKTHGNNHSTWWAAQVAVFASFVGDEENLADVWDLFRDFLVPHQIQPDGSCPKEEARTKSFSYSIMNLDGFCYIAHIAKVNGIDLWTFKHCNGAGLVPVLEYLIPYYKNPENWTKKQISPIHKSRKTFLVFAGLNIVNPEYHKLYLSAPPVNQPEFILFDMMVQLKQ